MAGDVGYFARSKAEALRSLRPNDVQHLCPLIGLRERQDSSAVAFLGPFGPGGRFIPLVFAGESLLRRVVLGARHLQGARH